MLRLHFLFVAIVLISLSSPLYSSSFDDESFCMTLESFKADLDKDTGKMVDKYTRNDGMALLCGGKIVEYKKFLFVDASDMRSGWQSRKEQQWNDLYCNDEKVWLDAINNGWTVAFSIITQDGKRFWHKAECK